MKWYSSNTFLTQHINTCANCKSFIFTAGKNNHRKKPFLKLLKVKMQLSSLHYNSHIFSTKSPKKNMACKRLTGRTNTRT